MSIAGTTQCCGVFFLNVSIFYDSISGTKSKVGYVSFADVLTNSCHTSIQVGEATGDPPECPATYGPSCLCRSRFLHFAGSFSHYHAGPGATGSINVTDTRDLDGNLTASTCTGSYTDSSGTTSGSACANYRDTGDGYPTLAYATIGYCGDAGTVSEEYTTATLIAHTVATLPAYSGDYRPVTDGGNFALRILSADESSYTVRRFKFVLKHPPTQSCYLKVWLRTRFVPADGSATVLTDLAPYEWIGTGDPCFPAPTQGLDAAANVVVSDACEVQEPATDGRTKVEIKKYSCLAGYEPADPDDDNARPTPDPRSNCLPRAYD